MEISANPSLRVNPEASNTGHADSEPYNDLQYEDPNTRCTMTKWLTITPSQYSVLYQCNAMAK